MRTPIWHEWPQFFRGAEAVLAPSCRRPPGGSRVSTAASSRSLLPSTPVFAEYSTADLVTAARNHVRGVIPTHTLLDRPAVQTIREALERLERENRELKDKLETADTKRADAEAEASYLRIVLKHRKAQSRPEDLDVIKSQSDALLSAQENSERLVDELKSAKLLTAALQSRIHELEGGYSAIADYIAERLPEPTTPGWGECPDCDYSPEGGPCRECYEAAASEPPAATHNDFPLYPEIEEPAPEDDRLADFQDWLNQMPPLPDFRPTSRSGR